MDLGGSQTRIWCFRGFGDLKPGFGSLKAFLKAANQALGPQVRPRALRVSSLVDLVPETYGYEGSRASG